MTQIVRALQHVKTQKTPATISVMTPAIIPITMWVTTIQKILETTQEIAPITGQKTILEIVPMTEHKTILEIVPMMDHKTILEMIPEIIQTIILPRISQVTGCFNPQYLTPVPLE